MKLLKKSAISLALFAATSAASANDWTVGVFAGQSSFDDLDVICTDSVLNTCGDVDDTGDAFGISVGYNFDENWGLEAGVMDLGEFTADFSTDLVFTTVNSTITVDARIGYFAGVGTLPLSDSLSLSARLGAFTIDGDVTSSLFSANDDSVSDSAAIIGVSLDYFFTENVGLQIRYDDLDELSFTGVGLKYRF